MSIVLEQLETDFNENWIFVFEKRIEVSNVQTKMFEPPVMLLKLKGRGLLIISALIWKLILCLYRIVSLISALFHLVEKMRWKPQIIKQKKYTHSFKNEKRTIQHVA